MKKIRYVLIAMLLTWAAPYAFAGWTWQNQGGVGWGTLDDPYLIRSASDWEILYKMTRDSGSSSSDTEFTGQYFKLVADISVGSKSVGLYYGFGGHFDGNGHTITFDMSYNRDYVAPFCTLLDGAVIENLHVKGTIHNTGKKYTSGLVGLVDEDADVIIRNCRVSATIKSGKSGDATNGGIVARTGSDSETTIVDCLFDGSFDCPSSDYCGGLVGYKNGTLNLFNCLFAPSGISISPSHCQTLARYDKSSGLNIVNCYYTETMGGEQGEGAPADKVAALGACWRLLDGKAVPRYNPMTKFSGSGTEADPYLIISAGNWNYLAEKVMNSKDNIYCDHDKITYSGKHFLMVMDISVNTMVGANNSKYFGGIFNGGGKTLTISYGMVEEYGAPFRYIHGATIKNLQVDGVIYALEKYAGGIAGYVQGQNHITSCRSSVTINSAIDGDGSHGGLVGEVVKGSTDIYFEDCLFDGKMLGTQTEKWGGFVGWNEDGPDSHFKHCLFNPSQLQVKSDGCYTFARRSDSDDIHFYDDKKSYYKTSLGSTQGYGTSMTGSALVTALGDNWELKESEVRPKFTVEVETQEFQGEGTAANPYIIASPANWNYLAGKVSGKEAYSGKYFRLEASIEIDRMIGGEYNSEYSSFSGFFDGNGKTLTLNLSAIPGSCLAPFGSIDGATIKNLVVSGTVSTGDMRPAGVVGFAFGNSLIRNCLNTVNIRSSRNADIDAGAFVATLTDNATLIIQGCAFLGSITYSNANGFEGGGFVGYARSGSTVIIRDCLFAPSALSIQKFDTSSSEKKHYMFVGGAVHGTIENSYYNALADDYNGKALVRQEQGKRMYSVTGGDFVTVTMNWTDEEKQKYSVSGITTRASTTGFVFENTYAGSGETVSLKLSYAGGAVASYEADHGTLSGTGTSGTDDAYTLTLGAFDTRITANGALVLYDTDDNSTVIADIAGSDNKVRTVTLSRTLVGGAWNSFCVPFNVSEEMVTSVFGSGVKVKKLNTSSFDGDALSLDFQDASEITAGRPFLIMPPSNVENPVFQSVTLVNATTPTGTDFADFVPVMSPTVLSARDKTVLFITGDGKLSFPSDEDTMKAFRAYIRLKDAAAGQQ